MKRLFKKDEKGFTLIEVMLVVIIIGIIAVIALPRLLVTKDTAEEKSCLSNIQAIGTAVEQFKWKEGHFPNTTDDTEMTDTTMPTLIGCLTTRGYLPADSTISGVCPSEDDATANYTYVEGTGEIYCTEHAPAIP